MPPLCENGPVQPGFLGDSTTRFGNRALGAGGHGARVFSDQGRARRALVAKRLPGVVGYVHDGDEPCEADHAIPGKLFELMSRFAPIATWLAGGALIGLGWLSVAMLGPLVGLGIMAGMLVATYMALEVA
ncbi:hypothetical protein OIE68_05250 [Nocardia vinacea]|uniref:Uncharacterized protein n=1 Tax=Nocardia vinacea TaxID=96468 RepID=A0ABZ1ZBN4_9NOCA|nr:hypothetical protein OIE68_05250 [Nocardia vinacea]